MAKRMMEIRPAAEEDVPALCDLYLGFHEFHAQKVPKRLVSLRSRWEEEKVGLAGRLREIFVSPDALVLVAEVEDRLVGFAELYLREDERTDTRPGCRYCYLQSMCVLEPERRRGVGRLLLKASETWARSHDAAEIRLDVWEFGGGPGEFYVRCGYRPYRRSLARSLKGPGGSDEEENTD
jgi:GNAT superfamily N-acetyltransferase